MTREWALMLACSSAACGERGAVSLLPEDLEHSTLLIILRSEAGLEISRLQPGDKLHVAASSVESALLFMYECADLDALGFLVGADGRAQVPDRVVRAPDRLFRFEQGETLTWTELTPDRASLSELPIEFSYPSFCRLWEPSDGPLPQAGRSAGTVAVESPDGSVVSFATGAERSIAFVFRGMDPVRRIDLPRGLLVDAARRDAAGNLWLYSEAGSLYRGRLEDLESFETLFEQLPPAPVTRPLCPAQLNGRQVGLSVLASTATTADVLVVDSSGLFLRFHRGGWTVLSDAAGEPGGEGFVCGLAFPDVTWLGPDLALSQNRSLRSFSIARIRFAPDGTFTVADDQFPERGSRSDLLDLGERGLYAALGFEGSMAHRDESGWVVAERTPTLHEVATAMTEGPGGSILFGGTKEGLRQYWPGKGLCRSGQTIQTVRKLARLGTEELLAYSGPHPPARWRLKEPGLCDVYPD